MRVLIAGCGYVGLALAAELARRGHQVTGIRRNPAAAAELAAAGIHCLRADLTQPSSLEAWSPAFDWVINCVSATGGGPAAYRATYLEGMRHLLNWLAASPPEKLVYTSSTGVYGQTDGSWVDETSPTTPEAPTSQTLLAAERVLLEAAVGGKVPGLVLRVAGIYGPGRGYWLKQFLNGEARLEGRGERVLNMIHRDDVVGAIIAGLERGRPGQIYNAVDDEPVTQEVLFEWLAQRLGRTLPPAVLQAPQPGLRRGLTSKRVSNQRLRDELGYSLKYTTFREGFESELGSWGASFRECR
jgi:nucleoside-diphosphate-sugar epimerase